MPQDKRRRKYGEKKKSPEKLFWTTLMTIFILLAAGYWGYNQFVTPVKGLEYELLPETVALPETTEEPLTSIVPRWEAKEPVTHRSILLLGLDNEGMGDAVMIVSYDLETFTPTLISLKRDTFIDNQRWAYKDSGQDHLAWANNRAMGREDDYHAGGRYTAEIVEDLLGIDIHAYASITFAGFVAIVDNIGSIEVEVNPDFQFVYGSLLPTGKQNLSGEQALMYSRHRHNPRIEEAGSESPAGDRVRRNQQVLKAILDRCRELNSEELDSAIDLLYDQVYTSLESWDILELANIFYHRDLNEMKMAVLPGEGKIVYQERIDSDMYYFYLDFTAVESLLKEFGLK